MNSPPYMTQNYTYIFIPYRKNFDIKKVWQIPSYERFDEKTLAIGIIVFTAKLLTFT